jgi:hypothetical protein
LTSSRRGPRRPLWPIAVSALTNVGYAVPPTAAWGGPATAVGHDDCMWHTTVGHDG